LIIKPFPIQIQNSKSKIQNCIAVQPLPRITPKAFQVWISSVYICVHPWQKQGLHEAANVLMSSLTPKITFSTCLPTSLRLLAVNASSPHSLSPSTILHQVIPQEILIHHKPGRQFVGPPSFTFRLNNRYYVPRIFPNISEYFPNISRTSTSGIQH
jgi:hypothetical protein